MGSRSPLWDKSSRLHCFSDVFDVNSTIATLSWAALHGRASSSLLRAQHCNSGDPVLRQQVVCPKSQPALHIYFDPRRTKPLSHAVRMGIMRPLNSRPEVHLSTLASAHPRRVPAGSPARYVGVIPAAVHCAFRPRCATISQRGVHPDSLEVCATTGPPSCIWSGPRSGLALPTGCGEF
jgi:hypothetical protein